MGYQANKIWFSLDFEGFNAEVKLNSIKSCHEKSNGTKFLQFLGFLKNPFCSN